MKVLVDTSVWSLALRRKNVNDSCEVVRELSQKNTPTGYVGFGAK